VNKLRGKRLTPATVLASLALLVALSGTSFAAATFISGSQIKPHSIPKNRLTGAAIRALKGQRGPAGPGGIQGPPGIASITDATGPAAAQCADGGGGCQVARSDATCPSGSLVVGGGFASSSIDDITLFSEQSAPNVWTVIAENLYTGTNTIQAQAVCAVGPGARAADRVVSSRAIARLMQRAKEEASR
jgi:hypothetical protein